MTLKKAYGPAFCAALSVAPTYMFGMIMKDRFLRCYQDAGLLQTSQLDGLDEENPISESKREEYRKWIVDCHKASFVPICLTGRDSLFTAEPAVVIPIPAMDATRSGTSVMFSRSRSETIDAVLPSAVNRQRGAMFRRVPSMSQKSSKRLFEALQTPSEGNRSTAEHTEGSTKIL